MPPLTFRLASTQDIAPLAALVNSAYRGDSSRAGWTTEADLLGGQRTDCDEIRSLLEMPDSIILIGMQGAEIVATLHLQLDDSSAYLGMFAIRPDLQGAGIGKHCLQQAERLARQRWGVSAMLMTVITLRHELIAYYERRGYRPTGMLKPFPQSARFGIPKTEGLELMVLKKTLEAAD